MNKSTQAYTTAATALSACNPGASATFLALASMSDEELNAPMTGRDWVWTLGIAALIPAAVVGAVFGLNALGF